MAGARASPYNKVTRSATEQPDIDMETSLALPAGPPGTTGSATEQPNPVPAGPTVSTGPCPTCGHFKWEIQVSFPNGMWWAMPHDLSDPILNEWMKGSQQVSFVWDWGKTRKGSYRPDGAETSHNRYIIDFDVMQQRNIDNDRTRTVKVVAVLR